VAQPAYDLRERKRTKTRLMIQAEALRLFAEKGYENTSVEDIAFAAAISPRTFFRYFATKEDVVIWDEYDPISPTSTRRLADLVEARPENEPLAETVRALILEAVGASYRRDSEGLLVRTRLVNSVPALRGRMLAHQGSGGEMLAEQLAQKRGLPRDDFAARVIAAAFGAAVITATDAWQRDGGASDLVELVERAIDALAEAAGELEPHASRPRRRAARRASA
jgi:AcrR family transcriptional regulator